MPHESRVSLPSSHDPEAFVRTKTISCLLAIALCLLAPVRTFAQHTRGGDQASHLLSPAQLDQLLTTPKCLEGYRTNQTGPLSRLDKKPGEPDDSTFTVEKVSVPSDGVLIRGWLYLPRNAGTQKFPLIVLTNGGGDGSAKIKSLSDWIAPVLSHCGIAAFVHDKRGTGESEGEFAETTYDDYVADAGNSAVFLSKHKNIDHRQIGVLGGSEGGRIAVLTASRFAVVTFAISLAGTVVSMEDDRIYAQMGSLRSRGVPDSVMAAVEPLWRRSFAAWASNDPAAHDRVDAEIRAARTKFDASLLPAPKAVMESSPGFRFVLPTWKSLGNDYLSEMKHFTKPWLAMFGDIDTVVPTRQSVRNIQSLMAVSGNTDYAIVVLPRVGHAPVDVETKRMVRIDNIVLNWLEAHQICR